MNKLLLAATMAAGLAVGMPAFAQTTMNTQSGDTLSGAPAAGMASSDAPSVVAQNSVPTPPVAMPQQGTDQDELYGNEPLTAPRHWTASNPYNYDMVGG